MPNALQELLAVTSPVIADVDDAATQRVKGFVSVETLDRSRELVSPEEFNIKQFMAAPVLMVNHKFWIDPSGNEVSVGRPVSLHVAKLAKNDNDDTIWDVVDVKTKEVVSTFPKQKVPNLKKGDRGLFVIAEITEKTIWDRVVRGELGAFSWRGLVQVDFKSTTEGIQKVLKNIDLFEISLVHMPDNPNSTFIVGKDVDGKVRSAIVSHVHLSKGRFETEKQVTQWLDDHDLRSDTILDQGENYVARQNNGTFDTATFVKAKMSDGVSFVCGELEDDSLSVHKPWITEIVGDDAVKEMAGLWNSVKKETTMDIEETTEEKKVETSEEKKEEKKTETKIEEKTDAEKASEVLSGSVASSVAEALKPSLDSIGEAMTLMASTLEKALTIKEETKDEDKEKGTEEKKPVEISTEEIKPEETKTTETEETKPETTDGGETALDDVQKTLGLLADSLLKVNKKVEAVAKSAPVVTTREEKVETEKSTKDVDPNAVFNGLWPMTGN